jgi:hypothetical protein
LSNTNNVQERIKPPKEIQCGVEGLAPEMKEKKPHRSTILPRRHKRPREERKNSERKHLLRMVHKAHKENKEEIPNRSSV